MKILVTGSKGQLGQALEQLAPSFSKHQFVLVDKDVLDICSPGDVKGFFKQHKPDVLVNCAAYTSVDAAEENVQEAMLVNARGAGILAEAAARASALMVHVSTDYVFDGKGHRPYTESDSANPRTVYGKSKLEGELEVLFNAKHSLIIRTSWLYSRYGHNFMKTILNKARTEDSLRVVFDQTGSPTNADDLAAAIMQVLSNVPPGARGEIYNFSNEGVCSWYDFAMAITDIMGMKCTIVPVLSGEFKTPAARPHYSVLDKSRIKKDFDLVIPHWRDSLRRCLDR